MTLFKAFCLHKAIQYCLKYFGLRDTEVKRRLSLSRLGLHEEKKYIHSRNMVFHFVKNWFCTWQGKPRL